MGQERDSEFTLDRDSADRLAEEPLEEQEHEKSAEGLALGRLLDYVRDSSRAGVLVRLEEAAAVYLPEALPEEGLARLLETLPLTGGLCLIGEGEASRLYSESEMSQQYARLAHRTIANDPAAMIAATVTEDSQLYARPTLVELFACPPFELSEAVIEAALAKLAQDAAYSDIRQVSASNGDMYLYSGEHVPHDLALSLAEWYSVGMYASP